MVPGSFAELRRFLPKAERLLQSLETEGWTVGESHTYDRPGQRFSRDFVLSNRKYPELAVKIVHLAPVPPAPPNIGIVSLTTDNLGGRRPASIKACASGASAGLKRTLRISAISSKMP